MIPAFGLLLGVVIGIVVRPDVPLWMQPYLPIAVVAALDAVFGGVRAVLDGIFNDRVFVISFLSNVVVAAFIVFGGSPSSGDLRDISLLTGEHRMRVVGVDEDHPDAHRWVPVMSPAQIRAMEPGQVLVMLRGLHTVVGWAPRITKRRGWKPVSLLNTTTATASTTTTVGKPRRPVHDLTDRTEVPSAAELEAMLQTTPDPDRRSTHDSDDSRTASNGEQGHGRRIRGWSWNFGRRTDGASPDEHGRGRR